MPSAVRIGALFINLDGGAGDIDDWLRPWRSLVDPHYAVDLLMPAADEQGAP